MGDKMSQIEILQYAVENGMLDTAYVQEQIEMQKRQELLKKHPYAIWEGSDNKWHTYLPDEIKGRVPRKRSTEKSIEDVVVDYWRKQTENPTIEKVFKEWNDRRLTLQQISNATHLRNEQIFKRHYKDFGSKRIKSIGSEEITDFLEEQITKFNLSSKSFANLKGITKGFFKRAKRRKLVQFSIEAVLLELDISENVFKKEIKEDYEEVFSEDEMNVMIKYLKKNPDVKNLGILLMFVAGIRVGELVALKPSVFDGTTIKIRRTETRYVNEEGKYVCEIKEFPKTDAGWRTVVVPNDYVWLIKQIQHIAPFSEFVFSDHGIRITTQAVRMRLKRLCKKLGIYHKSPHKIRKTYGTILLDNNIDNRLIMGQMGHTDILCTEEHYHRNRRSLDKKQAIISEIPEFSTKTKASNI